MTDETPPRRLIRYYADGSWEVEGRLDGQARTLMPNGCDARTLREIMQAWGTQGAPTTNRASRRRAQRTGDAARKAKRKKETH